MKKNVFLETPYHMSFAKKDENDPRRDKRRCVHYSVGKCGYNVTRCIGSAHCKHYSEEWPINNNASYDVNIVKKHQESMIRKREKLFEDNTVMEIEKKYRNISYCPICGDLLRNHECNYCGFQISSKEEKIKKKKSKLKVDNKKSGEKVNKKKAITKNEKIISKIPIMYDVTFRYCDVNGICKNSMHGNNLKCHVKNKEQCLFYKIAPQY